ncbi:hypothetical protein PR048_005603 [Dryococelus australis]|uniref:Uncharacterized protein n=1 Tax=Dryococelus australis TaxID=614101 RepID=A0ABQ9I8M0_9NEOP|nr:hypothetical protein PR048_005603 [Dryococelus australis]
MWSVRATCLIYVQILGPYPKTASRNEFVVTIVDPVSHWIVAQPIAFDSSLSSQVSCLIFKTFCDFGFTKCTISSVPPQISSDILNKLKKYDNCLRKVTAALDVPAGAAEICNIVKCQDKVAECAWLSELFSAWVQDNPGTWDKDLDEFLFEFRALPKNGAPSPFRSMFNRRPVRWSEVDKENIIQNNPVPELPKRRKLQGSLMKVLHDYILSNIL